MRYSDEIIRACKALGVDARLLLKDEARGFLAAVLERFAPVKTSGHLAIGHDSDSVPTDENELRLSDLLPARPIRMFFDQEGPDREVVVEVSQADRLGEVMEESFGMEYFLADEDASFLIAVNWYAIELAGDARAWSERLGEG